jgi:hypothetical protein
MKYPVSNFSVSRRDAECSESVSTRHVLREELSFGSVDTLSDLEALGASCDSFRPRRRRQDRTVSA